MAIAVYDYGVHTARTRDLFRRGGDSSDDKSSLSSVRRISEEAVNPIEHTLSRGRARNHLRLLREAAEKMQERVKSQAGEASQDQDGRNTVLDFESLLQGKETGARVTDPEQASQVLEGLKCSIVQNTALSNMAHCTPNQENLMTLLDLAHAVAV